MGPQSWLTSDVKPTEVFPLSYKFYRKDRSNGHGGGGVFLTISSIYESKEPEELQADKDCELIWAKVKVWGGAKDLYIGSCYKPPDNHGREYLKEAMG